MQQGFLTLLLVKRAHHVVKGLQEDLQQGLPETSFHPGMKNHVVEQFARHVNRVSQHHSPLLFFFQIRRAHPVKQYQFARRATGLPNAFLPFLFFFSVPVPPRRLLRSEPSPPVRPPPGGHPRRVGVPPGQGAPEEALQPAGGGRGQNCERKNFCDFLNRFCDFSINFATFRTTLRFLQRLFCETLAN